MGIVAISTRKLLITGTYVTITKGYGKHIFGKRKSENNFLKISD